ncbi:DNA polymerase alpha/epsilon subunit B-domain-containing protein [Mucor lusitanicus]|uniref:DNA polymerase alpha subunit B n=2 Tax=Mucor circinelloides f. lusitanicus TaxID=29924 RepID=A0A8H4F3J8_MUCCL|nr:DNA polymerase alpha/epsilon subunit B-domain-containing protein [Mucor lusitanicus]
MSDIKQLFSLDDSSKDQEVANELSSLCTLYSITPEVLKNKWEAFALTTGCALKPSLPYVKHLKNSLQRDFDRQMKTQKKVKRAVVTKKPRVDLSDYGIKTDNQEDSVESFMSNMFSSSNARPTKVMPLTPSASLNDTQISQVSSQFLTRKAAHVMDGQYNPHLSLRGDYTEDKPTMFNHLQDPIKPYRFMYEKTREKADMMDEHIDYIGSLIREHYSIEAFANPARATQEPIYAYGRICSDASEGRLNDQSVLLQLSRDVGMGKRVRLNLAKVSDYTLFPGQIVGVFGTNMRGDVFHVDQFLLPPMPNNIESDILTDRKPVEMIVASGPYTLDDDLSYQPLEDLLKKCEQDQPNVLLLMGPFLSAHHPRVASGKIESMPEEVFHNQIAKRLEQFLEKSQHSHVLLMPHADDMIQYFPLYPQPPLGNTIRHGRLHQLSNPAQISINGHNISASNMDILFKLAKEEISKSPEHTDRFSRLVRHVLQQHTYYPLYPHALGDSIDASQLVNIQVSWLPDILILPSQFKYFVKNVDDVVCINPGHLCKSLAAGSYARVVLHPTTDVNNQVRVDLFKL